MKKWMLSIGVLLILAAGAGGYYYWSDQSSAAEGDEAAFRTVQATRGNIQVVVSGTGSVVADAQETVTAGVQGTIAELKFAVGDTVKKGQVLAVFEKEDLSNDISEAQLSLQKQQLQMDQYEEQYKEAAVDEEKQEDLASIKINMEMLKLDMADKQNALDELEEEQAEELQVVATMDGEVLSSSVAVGDDVQKNTAIATIVDYSQLSFTVSVDELDIPSISVGQAVQVNLNALPDQVFEGEIESIAQEGTVSSGVAAYDVNITLKNHEGVLSGMSGSADVITASSQNVTVVPADAVVELMGRTFVRVPSDSGSGAGDGVGSADVSAGSEGPGTGASSGGAYGAGGSTGAGDGANGAGTVSGANAPSERATGTAGAGGGYGGGFGGGRTRAGGQVPGGADAGGAQGDAQSGSVQQAADTGAADSGAKSDAEQGSGKQQPQSSTDQGGSGQQTPDGAQQGAGSGASGGGAGFNSEEMMQQMAERLGLSAVGGTLKEVTVGISDENYVEIKSGLAIGDSVLVPLPQGTVGTASSEQQQTQIGNFGTGGFGGGGFSGVMPGGGGFTGGGRAGGATTQSTNRAGSGGGAR